jgi:hypothetical protein
MRVLYVAKISENELKGDIESKFFKVVITE